DDAVIVASWTRDDGMLPALVVERREYAGYWEYLLEDALYVSPMHPAFPGAALVGLDGSLVGIGAYSPTSMPARSRRSPAQCTYPWTP
ncbi:MAG: hypothetical protein GWN71_02550, partial [Gammaproteobacteria bacterium]|nr:hypothetical protein [Gemmatimonadota bacterium]NIU72488.1 hypothetical protein [Gammaproteobacteria bacterium]